MFSSFDSLRPQTCTKIVQKNLSNDGNGRRVEFVEVSSLLVLPKIATAGESV